MRTISVLLIALAMLAPVSATAAPMKAARTNTVVFDAAKMRVTRTMTGSCWTASIASRRRGAYRCAVGNGIYDPCFRINSNAVACPTNLAANSGLRIRLMKPLPAPNLDSERNPFMMQLAGGIACNIGTGTVVPDYPFYCTGNVVCTAPPGAVFMRPVFVRCGKPKNGMTVTGTGKYLVTTIYE